MSCHLLRVHAVLHGTTMFYSAACTACGSRRCEQALALRGRRGKILAPEHPGLRPSLYALANADSPRAAEVLPSAMSHWDASVHAVALRALHPTVRGSDADELHELLLSKLPAPHDSPLLFGGVAHAEVMHAALDALRNRATAHVPPRVLRRLVEHVHTFSEVHGDAEAGCADLCPWRCAARLLEHHRAWMSLEQHCGHWCEKTCTHIAEYEHAVLSVLEEHGDALVSRGVVRAFLACCA